VSAHLLAIAVGPVQGFIAAARRTRDLWFGSHLLSEISKAAAKSVHDDGGRLVFPAPEDPADLERDSPLIVANVILAELREADPKTIAAHAKEAAKNRWREYADASFGEHQAEIRPDIWNDQVDDVIEFSAAWMPLGSDYRLARRQVMRLLAGRKNGRDFPPAKGRPGIPKSSLDGLRESVLADPRDRPEHTRRRLRLQAGEQLDVVGLVKRTATGKRPYPSVARVAADPWIRGLVKVHGPDALSPLIRACEAMGPDRIHRLDTTDRGQPCYAAFPFEGTVVFRSRYPDLKEEALLSDREIKDLVSLLDKLIQLAGEPSPYLAILVADGDRMGKALSRIEDAQDHREFSRQLAQFAGRAREIVNQHSGVLVYAGGDDVLAFLAADLALECARQLRERFVELMKPWADKTGEPLTLSVGLAIAHFMEDLEDLLAYGRAAAQHAKGHQDQRNGLAVHVVKRGGGPVKMRGFWTDQPQLWLTELAHLQNSQAIPGRVSYDLHGVADVYENWTDKDQVADAIRRDALRIIKAKRPRTSGGLDEVRQALARVSDAPALRRLVDELLVARQIAAAVRQAKGGKFEGNGTP